MHLRAHAVTAALASTLIACAASQPRTAQIYTADPNPAPADGFVAAPPEGHYSVGNPTLPIVYPLDLKTQYLIDPYSRSCTLVRLFDGYRQVIPVAVPVDCATLAANHGGIAALITWLRPPAPPTTPAAPAAPAAP